MPCMRGTALSQLSMSERATERRGSVELPSLRRVQLATPREERKWAVAKPHNPRRLQSPSEADDTLAHAASRAGACLLGKQLRGSRWEEVVDHLRLMARRCRSNRSGLETPALRARRHPARAAPQRIASVRSRPVAESVRPSSPRNWRACSGMPDVCAGALGGCCQAGQVGAGPPQPGGGCGVVGGLAGGLGFAVGVVPAGDALDLW
jgi:hypothetical protein